MNGNFEMLRTNAAHIGVAPIVSSGARTGMAVANEAGKRNISGTFEQYLVDAVEYVNGKQMASAQNVETLITDPDSIDIHDVTIAMAEANMSLSLAQTVIDRLVNGWNEITTTR